MNTYLRITIVLLITFFVYGGFDSTCLGAEKESIDVVLVMDSSGSMKKTDPHSLRIPAAKLFISLLDSSDRAGVISFSDRGYPIAHLTPVDNDQNKDTLFRAAERISSKGLFTNLHDAFETGLEVLSEERVDGRQRIIILMSDGMMDVGDPGEDKALVHKLQNELGDKLKQEGVRVYTIAFTNQSDRRLLEKISKRTGGFYNLALTDKDFHVIFTSIFEGLKEPEMLPMEENGFLIDGSIQEVTIVASKTSPGIEIQINSPDGQEYTARNKYSGLEWFVSENFDMITVQKPVAGRWDILFSTGENNKAYIITDLKLQTNFEQLYAVFGENLDIQAWLEKEGTVIKEGEVLETTDVSMDLKNPDGNFTSLTPFNKGDGIFRRSISPFTPGNYRFTVVAKGKTFEREKSFLFNVANLHESKEDIEARRAEIEAAKEQSPPPENEGEQEKEGLSWTKIAVQFVAINILLGLVILVYLKYGRQIKSKLKTLGKKDPDESNDDEEEEVKARDELDSNDDDAEEQEEKDHITLEDEDVREHDKSDLIEESVEKGQIDLEVEVEQLESDSSTDTSKAEELDQKQVDSASTEEITDDETDEVTKKAGKTQVSRSEVDDIDKLWEGALEEQTAELQNNEDTAKEKTENLDLGIPESISTEREDTSVETEASTKTEPDDAPSQQTSAAADVPDSETKKDSKSNDTEDIDTLKAETLEEQQQETIHDPEESEDMDDAWADALNEQASQKEDEKPELQNNEDTAAEKPDNLDRGIPESKSTESDDIDTLKAETLGEQQQEASPDHEQSDHMDDARADALNEQATAKEQDKPGLTAPIEEKVAQEPPKDIIVEEQDTESGGTALTAETDQDDMADDWAAALEEQKEDGSRDVEDLQSDTQSNDEDDFLDLGLPDRIIPESGNTKMDGGKGDTAGA